MGRHMLQLSKSSMGMYLNCPMSYYLGRIQHVGVRTDYARLLGVEVHKFLAGLYRYHLDQSRVFFYSTIDKARLAWFMAWKKALVENADKIQFPDAKKADEYGATGWICIANYWKDNVNKPKPLYIEKRWAYPIMTGVNFVGIFDQVRQASLETISKFRPELVTNGTLDSSIDPVFIIDFKTNRNDYDMARFKPDADLMEQAAYQFELHEDLQVTAYYWLYYQIHHKLPAGFFWYHLRSGKWFYTYRTLNDFNTFLNQVRYVYDGLNAADFPKHVTSSCKYCDYYAACAALREDRPLMVSQGTVNMDDGVFENVNPGVKAAKALQLRFKNFTVPRVKKDSASNSEPQSKPGPTRVITVPEGNSKDDSSR